MRPPPHTVGAEGDVLLATKLHLPQPRPGFLSRSRLLERLDEGTARELVLVCTPAGFGKTSLLADYHLIQATVHDSLTLLLERLRVQLRLVLASRADPPLPLARLRARGQLTELRAVDLRFTPQEAAALLADSTLVHTRAGGWPPKSPLGWAPSGDGAARSRR